jgi:hypothetical protein
MESKAIKGKKREDFIFFLKEFCGSWFIFRLHAAVGALRQLVYF